MVILRSKEIREMEMRKSEKSKNSAEYSNNISKSAAAGVYENPGKIKELKRTIARVKTIINEQNKEN